MAELPLRTERLVVRMLRPADAEAYRSIRDDPLVARHQLWELPFTLETAERHLADQAETDEIIVGDWTTLGIELDGELIGDIPVHLHAAGGPAEIGYNLRPARWGHGYASEAVGAVAAHLFEQVGICRLYGELDPENVASQRVLEAVGLRVEALARRSFWWRGAWSDNLSYSATAEEHAAWRSRPRRHPGAVTLEPIGPETAAVFGSLETHHSQTRFVSPVLGSYRDALFPVVHDGHAAVPWLRGVRADGIPAGFVMVSEVAPGWPEPILWRLLVDRLHQRRGIGASVVEQVIGHVGDLGADSLLVSWREGPGSPAAFYLARGFVPTGERWDGEVVARLPLGS